ncbi:mechanosensitive ion channel family protein [Aquihabitans sp. G128]|uniref:mechanosensitive ion channel family protein n=1 Tax=Aquihabitans sp. G128 TaxID=2849779 RepID=UPI001C24F00A|nr:mechanosensitive ion channel family protein [Aquihabitans sp. G128]QXC60821.1 mechanosensitive ion channel family protein [Aquihabitans sp. G128]
MSTSAAFLFDEVTPGRRAEACSEQPGNACRFVIEKTDSVGLAKAADWLTGAPLKILLVLAGAWVLNRLVRRAVRRFAARIEGSSESGRIKRWRDKTPSVFLQTGEVNLRSAARAQTLAAVLRSICSGVIWGFATIYVLGALGLDLGPLLAGAGVAGVALGFGAQSLVKDFLSGIFMLIEDQYGVGDVVDIGEASGTVELVTLRVTRLRDQNGTVWHVPNGQILRVGNKSQQWARAVLDIAVAPTADLERAALVIGQAAEATWERDDAKADVLDQPEVLGLEYLGPDAATIRVQGKTRPGAQWRVSRLLRVQIAEALAAADIELPPSNFIRQGTGGR